MRLLLILTMGFWACSESTTDENEVVEPIIFGHYYGRSFLETCIENYKV